MLIKSVTGGVLACLVASCSAVGPTYQRPVVSLEARYTVDPNASIRAAADDAWWSSLADPTLNKLMQRALAQNLDMRAAIARISQAQAQLRATGVSSQLSGDTEALARATWTDGDYGDRAQVSVAPVFVIDLFGETRRQQEAAQAVLDRAVFETGASRLALQLALVSSYLDLRYFQALETLRNRAIHNQLRVVDVVNQREALRAENKMTLHRAQAELQIQRALLPQAKQGQQRAALRLATLMAEPFMPLLHEVGKRSTQPNPTQNIAPGTPANLLKNRPDIRAAEATLRAAVARVGVSEAQLYPKLTLNGSLGVASDASGMTVSLGPSISVPLFDRTARVAGRDGAQARAEEAELLWRKTVFEGVEEVQRNLSLLQTSDQEVTALAAAVSKFNAVARLSRDAFRLQAITHLEILDAEDSLTDAELRLINARRAYAGAWAQLNVAIGQGWRAHATDADGVPLDRISDE